MLQDKVFTNTEFLRLLGYTRGTLDTRTAKGEVAYAFGCPINAHMNEYLPLDAVAIMLTSMLSVGLGMKNAATVVREHWEEWLELVQHAERDPRLYHTIIPPTEQFYILAGKTEDDRLIVGTGAMGESMSKLGGGVYVEPFPFGVSICRVLHQLRTNAREYKVDLPKRFAVQPDDPNHKQWRAEIATYQKLAAARFKAKAKRKKVTA